MKRHRTLHRQLLTIGDSPDGGWGSEPDGRLVTRALSSDMSPLIESPRLVDTESELVIIETRRSLFAAPAGWRPPVNAYRCQEKFVVIVDLSGVPPELVQVEVQPTRLVIRGNRPPPEPGGDRTEMTQLIALEIDDGAFERVLDLPHEANPGNVTTEYRDGLLRISVSLRT